MGKRIPIIRELMTRLPIELSSTATLVEAHTTMRDKDIHHLPILSGTKLLGVITFEEVEAAISKEGDAAKNLAVGDLCHRKAIKVAPTASVVDVVEKMLGQHREGVVVVDGGVVVGIFTVHDALRTLLAVYSS